MENLKTHTITSAIKLLNQGRAVSTNTYSASVFYKRKDGSIWMNHPSYNDRKFFKNIKEFKYFNKDILFVEQKKQFNPRYGRYILESCHYGNNERSFWKTPKYGSKLRKEVVKSLN